MLSAMGPRKSARTLRAPPGVGLDALSGYVGARHARSRLYWARMQVGTGSWRSPPLSWMKCALRRSQEDYIKSACTLRSGGAATHLGPWLGQGAWMTAQGRNRGAIVGALAHGLLWYGWMCRSKCIYRGQGADDWSAVRADVQNDVLGVKTCGAHAPVVNWSHSAPDFNHSAHINTCDSDTLFYKLPVRTARQSSNRYQTRDSLLRRLRAQEPTRRLTLTLAALQGLALGMDP